LNGKPVYAINWGTEDLPDKQNYFDALSSFIDEIAEVPAVHDIMIRYNVSKVMTPEKELKRRVSINLPQDYERFKPKQEGVNE
jgi:hypothetical protein